MVGSSGTNKKYINAQHPNPSEKMMDALLGIREAHEKSSCRIQPLLGVSYLLFDVV